MGHFKTAFLFFVLTANLVGCVSSTESGQVGVDRRQWLLVPEREIIAASEKSYQQVLAEAREKNLLDRDQRQVARVSAIAGRLIPQSAVFRKEAPGWNWETHIITSDEINAWCMPGGKIVFYTGILEKLKLTDDEVAAVMGHEIAHALREHGRERMSQELLQQFGLDFWMQFRKEDRKYLPLVQAFRTVFFTLRHGREQELEADEVGLELMARAGYNPEGALTLWKKMGASSGGKMPEILSTHPSDENRLKNLAALLPRVRNLSPERR